MKTTIQSPVYIAGPMTGLPNMNFDAFDDAEEWLLSKGVEVVTNPARLDREAGFDPSTMAATNDFVSKAIDRDIEAIRHCKSIVMMSGWRDSTGACAEFHLAKWLGLDIYELDKLKHTSEMPINVGAPGDDHALQYATTDAFIEPAKASSNSSVSPRIKLDNPKDAVGSSKVPLDLVPAHVVMEVALAMLEGAQKYGAYNFRDIGIRASIYYSAMMRHMMAWWEGEDIDKHSGLSHVTKSIACLVILRDAMLMQKLDDDRPPKAPGGWVERMNASAKEIIEQTK